MADDLIFDIGMHHGEDSEYYLKKGFRVVAVEANPALCAEVREKLGAWIQTGQFTIVNCAIGEKPGTGTFFVNDSHSEWSTLYHNFVRRNEKMGADSHAIEVEIIRPRKLFADWGMPHYMKVDIEGGDWLCLADLLEFPDRPKYMSLEMELSSPLTVRRQFRLFREAGFRRFKVVSQRNVRHQVEPNPAREGKYVGQAFPFGSSGMFGADLPGEWVSEREARMFGYKASIAYRFSGHEGILNSPKLGALHELSNRIFWRGTDWWDIHATQ